MKEWLKGLLDGVNPRLIVPAVYLVFRALVWLGKAMVNLVGTAVAVGWLSPGFLGLSFPSDRGVFYFLGWGVGGIVVALLFVLAAIEIATLGHGWGFNLAILLLALELALNPGWLSSLTGKLTFAASGVVVVWLLLSAPKRAKF